MKKRLLITLLILTILCLPVVTSAETKDKAGKDETVYVMLKNDGEVDYVKVVQANRKSDFSGDEYTEKALEKELPILVDISYKAGGKAVDAEELAGYSGEVVILIEIKQNNAAEELFRNKYMTQLSMTLDLSKAKIIESEGATGVYTGDTATLAYTVLPGGSGKYELSLVTENFELSPIQITLMEYSVSLPPEFNLMIGGFEELVSGTSQVADGGVALSEGLNDLRDGMGEYAKGVSDVNGGAGKLSAGMKSYADGLSKYAEGIGGAAAGMNSATKGLGELNSGTGAISGGYAQILESLKQLQAGHEQLAAAANLLLMSEDPNMQALGQGIIAENEGLKSIIAGMTQANAGLTQFTTGFDEVYGGIEALNGALSIIQKETGNLTSGMSSLKKGASELSAGTGALKTGIDEMYEGIKPAAEGAATLAESQKAIHEGIAEINQGLEGYINHDTEDAGKVVSFADGVTEVDLVQFILRTHGIELVEEAAVEVAEEDSDPWYVELWEKIKALFTNLFD